MNMNKDYYISDLDGTLLNNQGQLSAYTSSALQSFFQKGLNFTIATGRSYASMRQVMADSLASNLFVISFDGALISPFGNADALYLKAIESKLSKELIEFFKREDLCVFLDILKNKQTHFLFENYQNEASQAFLKGWKNLQEFSNLRQVPLLGPYLKEKVLSLVLIDTHEKISEIKMKLELHFANAPVRFNQEQAPPFMGESNDILWILAKQATKQRALRELCSLQGKNLEKVTYFGDNTNDLGIFRLEKVRKIAVANAIEPILHQADLIIGSNEMDSVVRFIEKEKGL